MSAKNKRLITLVILLSTLSFTIVACQSSTEDLVAKVNGEEIRKEDFEKELSIVKESKKMEYGEEVFSESSNGNSILEELKKNVLNKLIIEKLISQEVEEMNITVSKEEIDKEIKNYKEELGGEEQYNSFMEKNNFSEEFLRDYFKKQLLFEKHRENFLNKTTISEKESKEFFEENKEEFILVKASHILVKTEEEGEEILRRLSKGEDFHDLAREKSIDKATAFNGGDLGYFARKGELALASQYEILSDTAFKLDKGETSGLLETVLGYHIILVEDKKDQYEDVKEDIDLVLKKMKHDEEISRLWSKAKIKIYMD